MVSKKEFMNDIRNDLGMHNDDEVSLHEAYVAQPKEYTHNTDLLSKKAKDAHEKLYKGYIEKLNRASAELDAVDRSAADQRGSGYRSLKIDETFNRNATYLHELHFANISDPQSEISYESLTHMRLTRDFGTFDDWQWDFIACAKSSQGGWAICAYDFFLQRYVNIMIDGHDMHVPFGVYPILVLDVWEHAYFRDYLTDKESYIMNMMREFNWKIVEARVKKAEMIHKVVSK